MHAWLSLRACLHLLQVKGLPFLTFDAGGALEMFDEQHYNGSIVWQRTAPALASTIAQALEAGTMATVRLADRVAHGRRQWIDWHVGYAKRRADFVKVPHAPVGGKPICASS